MHPVRSVLLCLALLSATGCGTDGEISGFSGSGTMSATVAGSAWTASEFVQASRSGNVLSISGSDGELQLQLTVPNVTITGVFNFGAGNPGVAQLIETASGSATWTSALVGGTGTLTLTTFTNERAAGTFNFSGIAADGTPAMGTRTVTNGTFDVRF